MIRWLSPSHCRSQSIKCASPTDRRSRRAKNNSTSNIGFEQKLWLAADKLRSNMDAAEYKHVVLGLSFLKYISDAFEEHHATFLSGSARASRAAIGRSLRRR